MDDVRARNQQVENVAFIHQVAADALQSFLDLRGYFYYDVGFHAGRICVRAAGYLTILP